MGPGLKMQIHNLTIKGFGAIGPLGEQCCPHRSHQVGMTVHINFASQFQLEGLHHTFILAHATLKYNGFQDLLAFAYIV